MKPWFKSLLFWFVLLPALFIVWSWLDSGRNEVVGYSYESQNVLEFHVQPGRIEINTSNDWWASCVRGEWEFGRSALGKARPEGGPFFLAKAFTYKPHPKGWGGADGGKTSIAFWFILLVYLAIWLPLFFGWRFLRRKRIDRGREKVVAEGEAA